MSHYGVNERARGEWKHSPIVSYAAEMRIAKTIRLEQRTMARHVAENHTVVAVFPSLHHSGEIAELQRLQKAAGGYQVTLNLGDAGKLRTRHITQPFMTILSFSGPRCFTRCLLPSSIIHLALGPRG